MSTFSLCAQSAASQNITTSTLRSMARLSMAYGNYDKAQSLAETALVQAEQYNISGIEMAMCLIDLGTVYSYQDMLEESESMLLKGIHLQKEILGTHPHAAYTLQMLSDVYRRQGRYDQAEDTLTEAFSIMLAYHNQEDRELLAFQAALAKLMTVRGQAAQAGDLYDTILARTMELYGNNHLQTAHVLMGAAQADFLGGNLDSASQRIDQALQIQERHFGPDHPMLIGTWLTKAQIDRAAGEISQAETWLNKAMQVTQTRHNAVALARIYEKINAIRNEGVYIAMLQ